MIEILRTQLEDREGILYWISGPMKGQKAGCLHLDGYLRTRVSGKLLANHRIIFAFHYNYFPDLVDHKDRNTLNNLITNLRDADKTLNAINTGLASNNKLGVKGVDIQNGKFTARIKVKGKKIHLGTFNNIEDATEARLRAEQCYWSELRTT